MPSGPAADLTHMQNVGVGFHNPRAYCRPYTNAAYGDGVPYRQGLLQT